MSHRKDVIVLFRLHYVAYKTKISFTLWFDQGTLQIPMPPHLGDGAGQSAFELQVLLQCGPLVLKA